VRAIGGFVLGIPGRFRRWWILTRLRLMAKLGGIDLTLDVHKTVRFETGVTFRIMPGRPITIRIGEGTVLEEYVNIQFFPVLDYDCELLIGEHAKIHRLSSMTVSGRLVMGDRFELGVGAVVRASQLVEFAEESGTGAYVSVFDFMHAIDSAETVTYQSVLVSLPVRIGRHVIIAEKATVTPGSIISDMSVVFPGAVVTGQFMEPVTMLAGVPARPMKRTDVIPMLENPMVAAFCTWLGDGPGAGFRTLEQVLADTPEPTRYVEAEHGWAAQQRRAAEAADGT
jgi:acetyltransferase-like isoleucine patch superfamily enzyme